MRDGPSITAELLRAALPDYGVADEDTLVEALGEARHGVSLHHLEALLVQQNVLSESRLALLKGSIAGLPVLDPSQHTVIPRLDASVAQTSGALVVDRAEPTVAFIEDLPRNVDRVARSLGDPSFDVWLMTTGQFNTLYKTIYTNEEIRNYPAAGSIYDVFDEGIRRRASDIHLAVGEPPTFRIDGALVKGSYQRIDQDWMRRELEKLSGADRITEAIRTSTVDFAQQYGVNRFRCNIGLSISGLTLTARLLPTHIPTPEEINLPPAIRRLTDLERGMVLVTGPTGSGKSTTLAALLNQIALSRPTHIITLEDPIEFVLPTDGRAHVDQRELGSSFHGFAEALRHALRQDPDVILVGELRDLETMRTALQAAETGHLVFATLHTASAPGTVGRFVSAFPADEQNQVRAQLAYILRGIVSQTLLPHASGKGRVAAFEILVSNSAVSNNLRKVDGHNQLRQTLETGRSDGMQTMEMALADLVRANAVRDEDAEFRAEDKDDFRRRVLAPDSSSSA